MAFVSLFAVQFVCRRESEMTVFSCAVGLQRMMLSFAIVMVFLKTGSLGNSIPAYAAAPPKCRHSSARPFLSAKSALFLHAQGKPD